MTMTLSTMGESSMLVFAADSNVSQMDSRSPDCVPGTSETMQRILATFETCMYVCMYVCIKRREEMTPTSALVVLYGDTIFAPQDFKVCSTALAKLLS